MNTTMISPIPGKPARYLSLKQGQLSQAGTLLCKLVKTWNIWLRDMLSSIVDMVHINTIEAMSADNFKEVRDILDSRFAEAGKGKKR